MANAQIEKQISPTWTMSYKECVDPHYLRPANKEVDTSDIDFTLYIEEAMQIAFNLGTAHNKVPSFI
jgi:hypothetical protein